MQENIKKLILVRHSKAENYSLEDKNRMLTLEGKEIAYKMAHVLKNNLHAPEVFFSSPASRALKTAEIFLEVFGKNPSEIQILENLYTFSLQDLREVIYKLDNKFHRIILFGHNFAFPNFINEFGDLDLTKFPPSSVAILESKVTSWREFKKGKIDKILNSKKL